MIKAIIVDDEKDGAEVLQTLIEQNCPDVHIVALAYSIESGIASILEHTPGLVFLDIEMPTGTGFDILRATQYLGYETIFTTAYENYAVKAFKTEATDYLLKPIDTGELTEAIQKAAKRMAYKKQPGDKEPPIPPKPLRLQVHTREGVFMIEANDIIRLEAESNYTYIFMRNKKKLLVSKTLKSFEDLLGNTHFCRVHSSHLINLNEIDRYVKGDGGTVILKDAVQIPVSRANKAGLLKRLDLKF
jgi:two-component system LytT family response regulator